jgi:nuclease HARBI1
VSLFAFVDFRKNLKLHLQPIGMYYLVAAILVDCHTCFYGSQVASFFKEDPPFIYGYLHAPVAERSID